MIRDGILRTKGYELECVKISAKHLNRFCAACRCFQVANYVFRDCQANHARKLRELFFATVSLVGSFPPNHHAGATERDVYPKISEREFLDANDISK